MRKGNITTSQKKALDSMGDKYIINYNPLIYNNETFYNFKDVAGNKPITVEIGFGMGKATAIIAEKNPDKFYIGIEIYEAGVGRLLLEIKDRNLDNIAIIKDDAAQIMKNMIAPSSLDAVHLFFPDPWHKKRHNKRRLLKSDFLEKIATCLKTGGYLYMVTDWQDYGEEILANLQSVKSLHNEYGTYAPSQTWRPETKFEQKGLDKHHEIFEILVKKI